MSLKRSISKQIIANSIPNKLIECIPSLFDGLPDSAYVRESQLVQKNLQQPNQAPLPISSPTSWRGVKAGTFPKPIKLSNRITAWRVGDIRAWLIERQRISNSLSDGRQPCQEK